MSDDQPLAQTDAPDDGDDPYPFWMPPTGEHTNTYQLVYERPLTDRDDATTTADDRRDAAVDIRHSVARQHVYLERVALMDAYDGAWFTTSDGTQDSHPLDALRALRGVQTVLSQLRDHPLFTKCDTTTSGHLDSVAESLAPVIASTERTLDAAGIPHTPEPTDD